MSQRDFFRRKRSTSCGQLISFWAEQRGVPVRSAASVRVSAEDKRAPYSELCMQTRCAGKRIRAFAIGSRYGTSAITYTDNKGACHFESGSPGEVMSPAFRRAIGGDAAAGLGGARRRKRRRR